MFLLGLVLATFTLPARGLTIGPITFEDRTTTPAGTPAHGLTISTVGDQEIPPITFKFLVDGNPSQSAAIRRGPSGNAVVQGWGIEGPTEGYLTIDFGQNLLGFSAGIGLLVKSGEGSAVVVESFGPEGDLVGQQTFPSQGASDGSFSSVHITVSSEGDLIRSARISWSSEARRFFFDNLVLVTQPVAPEPPPSGHLLSAGATNPVMARLSNDALATGWLLNGILQVAIINAEDTIVEGPRFASLGNHTESAPAILALRDGGFAVAWYSSAGQGGILPNGFYLRVFSNEFRTFAPPELIVGHQIFDPTFAKTSLSETGHGINLSWSDGRATGISHYANGNSTALGIGSVASNAQVGCDAQTTTIDGLSLVVWCEPIEAPSPPTSPGDPTTRIMGQTFSSAGSPIGNAIVVSDRLLGEASDLHIKTLPALSRGPAMAAVTWRQVRPGGRPVIFARLLRPTETRSPVLRIQETANVYTTPPDLSATDDGFLVTWKQRIEPATPSRHVLKARLFHRSGAPASGEFELVSNDQVDLGTVAVGWSLQEIQLAWENTPNASTAPGVFLSRFPVPPSTNPCTTSETTLCLGATQRFRASVQWHDFQGNMGEGVATQITGDTGYFWFFQSGAADLVVKVIDGTGSNSHHWLFFGSLTNVEFDLIVEDLLTGTVKTYHNPSQRFASVGDTIAFEELALPSQDGTTGTTGTTGAADAVGTALVTVEPPANQQNPFDPGWSVGDVVELDPTGRSLGLKVPGLNQTVTSIEASDTCAQLAETQPGSICLADRFLLSCEWQDFSGGSGLGHGGIIADDTGSFWFFDQENIELMIKIVDGRVLNEHFWVFYGALTNVGFSLSVTDTVTGQEVTYTNPSGTFASVGDLTSLSG